VPHFEPAPPRLLPVESFARLIDACDVGAYGLVSKVENSDAVTDAMRNVGAALDLDPAADDFVPRLSRRAAEVLTGAACVAGDGVRATSIDVAANECSATRRR
jgi:hypothetical protein